MKTEQVKTKIPPICFQGQIQKKCLIQIVPIDELMNMKVSDLYPEIYLRKFATLYNMYVLAWLLDYILFMNAHTLVSYRIRISE